MSRGGIQARYDYVEPAEGRGKRPKLFNSFSDIAEEYGWTKGIVAGRFQRGLTRTEEVKKVVIKGHTFIRKDKQ